MNAAERFVECLEAEGVRYIFGVPGEENLDFVQALKGSKIELIVTRHEQAAGFMAATIGRLTRKAGVCLSTLGPGATNLVTAAAYAQLGGMPMLMITGQKPIKKSKQGQFQIVDVVEMMEPLTKFTKQIVQGSSVPLLVREAVRLAEEQRPGAVHLELPEDVAAEPCELEPYEGHVVESAIAHENALDRAAQMLSQAQRPIVLVGAACNWQDCSGAITDFLQKTGIYAFSTQMGKGVIDERHSQFIGTAALSDHDYLHCALNRSDLILNIGHDVVEKPPFIMERGGTQVIHIHEFSAKIDDVYFPQHEVVGDIANAMQRLVSKVDQCSHWDLKYFENVSQSIKDNISKKSMHDSFPIIPQFLVSEVRRVMPENGIITLDNGIYKIWFARNYSAYSRNSILLDNALATMGAGFPSAMAAKLVYPDRPVMAICGDGGFMMNSQELETAVRLKLNLLVLVLRDDAYGMIRWKQSGSGYDDFGMTFGNPDFVSYAQSYGAHGYRLENSKQLYDLSEQCLNSPGVHLIEVPVDYSENERVLIEELKQNTCQI